MNNPRPRTSQPAEPDRRSAPKARQASWRFRPQLLSDAVVAGYIHGISTRHRRRDASRSFGTVQAAPGV
jgi:hypothetical protein